MLRKLPVLILLVLGTFALAIGGRAILRDPDAEALAKGQGQLASSEFAAAARTFAGIEGDPGASRVVLQARLLECRALILGVRKGALERPRAEAAAEKARRLHELLPADHVARGRSQALLADAFEEIGRHDAAARIYADRAREILGEGHKARVAGYYLSLAARAEKGEKSKDPLEPDVAPDPARAVTFYSAALDVLTSGAPLAAVSLPLARNLIALGKGAEAAKVLEALVKSGDLPEADVASARFHLAKALVLAKKPLDARAQLLQLLALESVAETRYGADGLLLLADTWSPGSSGPENLRAGVETWKRFLARHPDHEAAARVRQKIADAWYRGGEMKNAIAAYRVVAADTVAKKEARALALFRIGECERGQQRFDAAREAFRRYLAAYPDDARVPQAQTLLPELLLEKAKRRRQDKDVDGAVAALRAYLGEYPLSSKASGVAVEVGLILRGEKRFDAAATALRSARDRYRSHDPQGAARAGYLLSIIDEEDRKDLETAAKGYQAVVKEFANTQGARQARQRLAVLQQIELGLSTKKMAVPDAPATVALAVRNVPKVTFRVYHLDAREYFERKGTLAGAADIEVALVKADRTFDFEVPSYRRYRRDALDVPLTGKDGKPLAAGAWLVAVEAEERRSVVLVLVSPIRLVVKQSPREVFCWAVDAKTGEPREGVEVLVRGPGVSSSHKTGADGVARITHDRDRGGCRVLGVVGDAVAPGVVPDAPKRGKTGLAPRASFMLDRPIYRPGSELRFRAVLRAVDGGELATPAKTKVPARLRDPKGRIVDEAELVTGRFGTVHGTFQIPFEGALGDHRLELDFAKSTFNETVPVEEYKKPEFVVGVNTQQGVVRPGEEVDVAFDVSYYFGGPVKSAPYEWRVWRAALKVDRDRYLSHAWYLRALKGERPRRPGAGLSFVASGGGVTDEAGKGSFPFRTVVDSRQWRYVVQVMVKDTSGQWVAGGGTASAGPVDRFAVVLADRRTYRVGDKAEVRVVTADLLQKQVATRGELVAFIERKDAAGGSTLERVAGAAVDTGLDGEATVRMSLDQAGDYVLRFEGRDGRDAPVVAQTAVVVTGERHDLEKEARLRFEKEVYRGGETASMHLSLPVAGRPVLLTFEGEHVLDYRILTPKTRSEVHAIPIDAGLAPNVTVAVAATRGDELLTSKDEIVVLRYLQVEVAPAKTAARPGEKVAIELTARDQSGQPAAASLAVRAFDGALANLGGNPGQDPRFVFNRDRRPHLVATGSSYGFKFLGQTVGLDPDLLSHQEELQRAVRLRELQEKSFSKGIIAPIENEIAPEEEAMDQSVNEAIGLGGGAGGAFGGRRGGRRNLRAAGGGKSSDRRFSAASPGYDAAYAQPQAKTAFKRAMKELYADGESANEAAYFEAGLEGLELPMMAPELRERFLEVAGWWPDVVTGADGTATVTLDLPDNLTSWSLAASGATRGTAVGQGTASVRVSKPVMVRLERPRFLTSRDQIEIPATVHSNVEGSLPFELAVRSLDPGRLDGRGMTETRLQLEPGDVVRRDFGFDASSAGVARLEARALSSSASDALKVGLPLIPFGEPWSDVRRGELVDRLSFAVDVPADAVPGSQAYQVVIEAGVRAELFHGLRYLARYPYGCLEQSVNRWLPAMLMAHALQDAGRSAPMDMAGLRTVVEQGVHQLIAFQSDDGGFGYWPNGPSHPWATALTLGAIARAAELGYHVDSRLIGGARNGARRLADDAVTSATGRVALGLALARAGGANDALLNRLFRERGQVGVPGLARLVILSVVGGRPTMTRSLMQELERRRQPDPVKPFGGRRPADTWVACDLTEASLALIAYELAGATTSETAPLVRAVRDGLRRRKGSTRGVALAIEALASVAAREGALAEAGPVRVLVDGKEVATHRGFGPDRGRVVLALPAASLGKGRHEVVVTKSGGAAAACRLVLRHVRPAAEVAAAGNLFTVTRRVTAFQDPDRKVEKFRPGFSIIREESRPRPVPPTTLAQAVEGWKVTVELELTARENADYVVIQDPQLAGLEVIESGIRGPHDRYERRDASLVFFVNRVTRGSTIRLSYPCYVVHRGRFHGLPAQSEEMYAPESWGRSSSLILEVLPDAAMLARVEVPKPTPDELYGRGRDAFGKKRWADAITALEPLLQGLDLRDEIHDRVLAQLLVSYLRTDAARKAVATWDELAIRNPKQATLVVADRERLGRALLSLGDHGRAREQFQSVVLDGFAAERRVADAYRGLGQDLRAVRHLADTVLRYPAVGSVPGAELEIAGAWLGISDASLGDKAELLPASHRVLWRDALAAYADVMAWYPAGALAEDAGYRRVELLGGLGLIDALIAECGRYLGRHPVSHRADEVTYYRSRGLFNLDRHDDAAKLAEHVWGDSWNRRERGGRVRETRSPYRFQAGYLIGKVFHVKGDYDKAVEWYGRVRKKVPDANQSWLFFTRRELAVEPVTTLLPVGSAKVPFRCKNLDEVRAAVYPVDLSVLFAVKKSFDRLATAELSGIRPEREKVLKTGAAKWAEARVEGDLGKLEPGAYLVTLRAADQAATTLVLVTDCRLTIQRGQRAVRVYLTDGKGKPVRDARIKLGVSGRIFGSGTTDERGMLKVDDPGRGTITVVAEKDSLVGLGTHR